MLRSTSVHLTCLVFFVLFLCGQALAWTPGLKEAADAFALGKATPAQEMMIFVHNKEINLLAQEGKITMSTYRNCQEEFFKLNEGFANKAVRDAGFDPSISNRKYNPGTDTDVNVLGKGGKKVTLNDIKKIDGNYQKIVQDHFRSKGLNPPASNVQTETDFMPHPKHTDPEEFQRIVDHVNKNGGTAYKDPRAASAQSKLGTGQPMTIDEASTFSSTMKDFADTKINKANALRAEAKSIRSSNPGRAEYLEAQARQFDYQAAKYHNRIDAANNHLRKQNGLPENPRNITGFQQSADIIEISGRNPFTGKDASTIRNLHQSALQSSTDDMIDTLVEIARKNPSQAAQIQKALGKEINRLPANRAGQAIERIESATKGVKGLDASLAKGAAAEARLLKQAGPAATKWASFKDRMKNVSGFNRMTKFSVVMTAGGAVLMAHQGISITLDNVKATDTLWDYFRNCYYHAAWEGTGIGPAFEQAQREEIERYMKEFEHGQSPSTTKHLTFTILKTGVYLGRDALIGVLYLPDTIWEYFTQEKEMEAYAAMQNELARVMRQMVKDQREFNEIMANMKKMGLQDADAKPYLDCLCAGCGGSLGGFFNPGCTSDIGHGPCQCNGPLTIWKTPLPAGNKQAQYDCFNKVAKMRYDEARAVFDKWQQQMINENAKSVQPELDAIKQDINTRKVMEDENTARDVSDRFAAIKDLLLPQEVDTVRTSVGPSLENHAVKNLEAGNIDRAVDNQDRALNKVGPRNFQQQSDMNQRKAQYEKWAEKWRETKDKKFREIDDLIRKNQTQHARGEIDVLEYQMLKDPTRPLPPAIKDPAFLALKERLADLAKRYEQAMQDMWAKVKPLGPGREHHLAIPILEKALEQWEHPHHAKEGLQRQLGYHRAELKRAEDKKKLGQHYEKNNELAHAVREYEDSLRIQKDPALERDLARLKTAVQNQTKAKELWAEAQRLQQGQSYEEAIKKYKEGLAIWNDPAIKDRVAGLEKLLADRKKQEAAKASQTAQNEAAKPQQTAEGNAAKPAASSPTSVAPAGQPVGTSSPQTATGVQSGGQTASQAGRQAAAALQPVGGDAVNLALGKPATQSSTYAGTGVDQGPHHAVDGKTSGRDPHDLIHTNYEANPWWRVDLGADAAIQRIRIHNRTNPEVKANLSLELLVSQDGRNWTPVYGHDRTVFTVLDLPVAVSGRHVMARLNSDHDALQLYEIEVWGRMTGAVVASGKVGAGTGADNTPVADSSPPADGSTVATSAVNPTLPAGWRNEQVGNVSFAVPASWGVVTENEPEVEMLHLHWDGDFDSPLHGISAGIALDWARAKAELSGGRVVRLGGVDVVRYDDGPAINLLFPEMSGNRGVLMVVFQGPGGNPGVIESVLQTIRVGSGEGDQDPSPVSPTDTPEVSSPATKSGVEAPTPATDAQSAATGQGWVLVARNVVRGETPEPSEGGEARVEIGEDAIEMLLATPYGIGIYGSKNRDNPQRLHARYSWKMPTAIQPGGQLVVPVTQRVLSNKTGNWASSFGVAVSIENRWDVSGATADGQVVKPYALGLGGGKPEWMQQDLTVTYQREWLWTTDQPGSVKTVVLSFQGIGAQKIEYRYEWK